MKTRGFIFLFFFSSFILLGTLGCQPVPAMQVQPPTPIQVAATPKIEIAATQQAPAEITVETLVPQPRQADAPLRFTFPTPQPPPISLWRPPLYDTPWALAPQDHFFFTRPISADEINWPLADYRYGGIFFRSDIVHTGVDVDAKRGTTVQAAGPGQVMFAGNGLYRGEDDPTDPYGLAVTIRHDFGF
ncbi:M23 family metallopeptidase, partial [bacterium]|nr:M23 family metallopeptidase [bacterium]